MDAEFASDGSSLPPVADASALSAVRWARFVMPTYGDAGEHPASFTSQGNVVRDNVSGLRWHQEVLPSTASFEQAASFCVSLPTVDGRGWRLPSRIELVTLLDVGRSPKLDAAFSQAEPSEYWTSSEVRPLGEVVQYWTVDFGRGGLSKKSTKQGRAAARCVLGGAS